jgi:hypothetical protein
MKTIGKIVGKMGKPWEKPWEKWNNYGKMCVLTQKHWDLHGFSHEQLRER